MQSLSRAQSRYIRGWLETMQAWFCSVGSSRGSTGLKLAIEGPDLGTWGWGRQFRAPFERIRADSGAWSPVQPKVWPCAAPLVHTTKRLSNTGLVLLHFIFTLKFKTVIHSSHIWRALHFVEIGYRTEHWHSSLSFFTINNKKKSMIKPNNIPSLV